MKKITFLIIATIMATISATAGTGWFQDFLTLKVNGVETPNNYYIGSDPGSGTSGCYIWNCYEFGNVGY
jgi:hypothetical protein